jgi:hypothetical protein
MDFFTIPQGNGILAVNEIDQELTNFGFYSCGPATEPMIMNGNIPLPPPKNLIAMQQMKEITALSNLAAALKIANFQNDNIPLPPPKN